MIRIENLYKSYGSKVLLNGASYHFPENERLALIGENGTGKSTLLNILIGLESCDEGQVLVPAKIKLGFLPQEPNPHPREDVLAECEDGAREVVALGQAMASALKKLDKEPTPAHIKAYESAEAAYKLAGGYALTAKASAILTGLGFTPSHLKASPLALSGGWRMRLELARLFMQEPDFLVLDEPTNHLDLPSLIWVEKYLQSFRGSLLFVSHDRALLNRLATYTLHLHRGKLRPYKGNFDQFVEARQLRAEQELAQRSQIHRRKDELETFVRRFGAKATKAKQAHSKMKQIERLTEQEEQIEHVEREDSLRFSLPKPLPADRIIYQIDQGAIGYREPLSQGLSLQVERGQKIAVIGANGIGKSTLLKTMVGKVAPLRGRFDGAKRTQISYFSQDQLEVFDPEATVIENVMHDSSIGQAEARSILASFLFRGEDVFKPTKVLSGGEKSRLGLASVLAQKANFLLLDEPTNHLDMKSTASLIQALQDYQGTLLFVSHDRSLINEVCTHVFVMTADGQSRLFEGQIDDYLRLAELSAFPNVLEPDGKSQAKAAQAMDSQKGIDENSAGGDDGRFRELKKQKSKLERQLEKLNQSLSQGQKELAAIDGELVQIASDNYQGLQAAHEKRQRVQSQLDACEIQWLEASEEWEAVQVEIKGMGRTF